MSHGEILIADRISEAIAGQAEKEIALRNALARNDLPLAQQLCAEIEREGNISRIAAVMLERQIAIHRRREPRVRA